MNDLIQTMKQRFGWTVSERFSEKERQGLLQTGDEISTAIEKWLPGMNGDAWIRRNLGTAIFHRGGLPQKVVSLANNGAAISLVFPNRHVWLDPGTFDSVQPTRWVAHELGHVLDNRQHWLAIWWGGGPADELMKALNAQPQGLRWANTKKLAKNLPAAHSWTQHNQGHRPNYGDNSSADYFAETWMYSIYRPDVVPVAARAWFMDWMRDQTLTMVD